MSVESPGLLARVHDAPNGGPYFLEGMSIGEQLNSELQTAFKRIDGQLDSLLAYQRKDDPFTTVFLDSGKLVKDF